LILCVSETGSTETLKLRLWARHHDCFASVLYRLEKAFEAPRVALHPWTHPRPYETVSSNVVNKDITTNCNIQFTSTPLQSLSPS